MNRPPETPSPLPRASAAASILAALLGSLCCAGPLVGAALGIGGAGFLLRLGHYRLYMMGLATLLLGLGFYFAYRRPTSTRGRAACGCDRPKTSRFSRVALWLATFVVIGFLSFPYLAALAARNPASAPRAQSQPLRTITLSIAGMDCGACALSIRTALTKLDGVAQASVSFAQGSAVVAYDPARVPTARLIQVVGDLGFRARVAQ